MDEDKLMLKIQSMVQAEVKAQAESQLMQTQEAATSDKSPRVLEAELLLDETVPNLYLNYVSKDKYIKSGHRGNIVDLKASNGRRYYNVSVKGEQTVKFGKGQKFLIYFTDEEAEAAAYGIEGTSTLTANPIKLNNVSYIYSETGATSVPTSQEGLKTGKFLQFCSKRLTIDDILNKRTAATPNAVAIAPPRTVEDIDLEYKAALKSKLGLTSEDELPSEDVMKQIYDQQPEVFDAAMKEVTSNSDRPSMNVTKEGIAMAVPGGQGRLVLTETGTKANGQMAMSDSPNEPMNPIGIGSTPMPMDVLPQGNVMMPHPKRLPDIADLISLGIMSVKFVKTVVRMGEIIADMQEIREE